MIDIKDLPDRCVSRNIFHSILPNFKRNILFRSRSGTGLTATSKKENTRRPRHTIRPRKKRGVHASGFLSTLLFFCFEIVEIPCQEQELTHGNFSCSCILPHKKRREVECPYDMRLSTAQTGKDKQPTPHKGRYAQTDRTRAACIANRCQYLHTDRRERPSYSPVVKLSRFHVENKGNSLKRESQRLSLLMSI